MSVYGKNVFRKWHGRKHTGPAIDAGLWDSIMLTLEAYSKADLQRHADALQADLLQLKLNSDFVFQPKQDAARTAMSKNLIESRIRLFQRHIDDIRGVGVRLHADQKRLFSHELKVRYMPTDACVMAKSC